jgi:hypothetical protein
MMPFRQPQQSGSRKDECGSVVPTICSSSTPFELLSELAILLFQFGDEPYQLPAFVPELAQLRDFRCPYKGLDMVNVIARPFGQFVDTAGERIG